MLTLKLPNSCSLTNKLRYLQHQGSQSKQYLMVGHAVHCAVDTSKLGSHRLHIRMFGTITDLVRANNVEKSLRMVISFGGVNQKNFWSALEERLAPPMKKVRLSCCHLFPRHTEVHGSMQCCCNDAKVRPAMFNVPYQSPSYHHKLCQITSKLSMWPSGPQDSMLLGNT